MPSSHTSLRQRLVVMLCSGTVLLAPALSFSIQPITGKFLLPVLGGMATTWLSTLIFFQFSVLAGYLVAYGIIKLPVGKQVGLTVSLAVLSALFVRFPPVLEGADPGVLSLLLGLSLALLLPVTFLFSVGIILHAWLGVYQGRIPWHLYALSNTGSILALLLYPFLIEPYIDLTVQTSIWRGLLGVLCLLIMVLGWFRLKAGSDGQAGSEKSDTEKCASGQVGQWLLLSFLSCLLFMAGTRELTAELGSHPLAWVLPLALYLGAFTVTFSGAWKLGMNHAAGLLFAVLFTIYVYQQGLAVKGMTLGSIAMILASVGTGCVLLNGCLFAARPKRAFAFFYIVIALGGILAGLFSTLAAPYLFGRNYELYVAAGGAFVFLGRSMAGSKLSLRVALPLLLILIPGGLLWQDISVIRRAEDGRQHHFLRNIYSQNILVVEAGRIAVNSEATLHGSQFTHPSRQSMPTAYYHPQSPIGVVFDFMNANQPQARSIGAIGLGAGTVAAYAREGDEMTFWDIDPEMIEIAEDFFRYVANSPAAIDLEIADGRIGLRNADAPFDMLIVDAFTGDSVPTHLLTWEAFDECMQATPEGWLVFHISSRWLDVTPIIQANLERAGRQGVRIMNRSNLEAAIQNDFLPCIYVIVPPVSAFESFLDHLRAEPARNPFIAEMQKLPSDKRESIFWTDGRHSVTQLLDWQTILSLQSATAD